MQFYINIEFLMILRCYRNNIIEIPVDINFSKIKLSFIDNFKSTISVIGLMTARFLDIYKYNFRLPIANNENTSSFFSLVDL